MDNIATPDPQHPPKIAVTSMGHLKIFFGYIDGVGKTHAMLRAAQQDLLSGQDVAVGCCCTASPKMQALLEAFPCIPCPDASPNQNAVGPEMDLDYALQRHPALLLVDDLAHANPSGYRHRKRYQDVEELLRAGIDIYTTLNVQQIESLGDISACTADPASHERVPDSVFNLADQVELIDLVPEELLQRCTPSCHLNDSMYTPARLAVLRELALRRVALHVNRQRQKAHIDETLSDTGEHILICLSDSPTNAKVIRTAARLSEVFQGAYTALFVETSSDEEIDSHLCLQENLRLAEQLGARIATVYGEDIPSQIVQYARVSGVTKIVIGRSNGHRHLPFCKKSLVESLTGLAPDLDIYIIPAETPTFPHRRQHMHDPARRVLRDSALTVGILVLTTLMGALFDHAGLSEANIITVYILGVLFISMLTSGKRYGAAASFASVFVFNFFFTTPRFTLLAYDPGYPLTFFVMFTASFLTSTLTMQVKKQARQSAQKAWRTEILLETSQKLQQCKNQEEILQAAAGQLMRLLGCSILFYPSDGNALGNPCFVPRNGEPHPSDYFDGPSERAAAEWVLRNNKHAGATTDTLPNARCLCMSVRNHDIVFAVVSIAMERGRGLDAFEKSLLIALLRECALALEKERMSQEKSKIELQAHQEQLRTNLLRAISHDLRTPLTSISGNAGVLMSNSEILDERKKQCLYVDIYEDSLWLINLVENLLSVTRIENQTMQLRLSPELVGEVIDEALHHLSRRQSEHPISVTLSDDLLMARMDSRLIVQVLLNIVNNAIKYTPPGSPIDIVALRMGTLVCIEISDCGNGVSDADQSHLFDMFYTGENRTGDSRRGLGLGLFLCKSIITAHGGTIAVRDNKPHGAILSFTLPAQEVELHE